MIYDGFISYSHAADDLLAPRLQAGLQRFAKPWWTRRAVRIFRDESSLSANPHLWSSITEALDTSGWFVLLLSPDAASSEWVNQEIAYWVENRDPSRILPVVTDGTFGWADDVMTGSAVPDALQGVFTEEPRWVDLRFAKGEEQLDLNNPTFSAAIADIASAIRGVPKDELESEEVRQHRRTVRTAWAAGIVTAALAVAAVGFGVSSGRNADEAERQATLAAEQAALAQANAEAEAQAREEADDNATAALEQADRADSTARRLIEIVLPIPGAVEDFGAPVSPVPRGLPPSGLEELGERPTSIRLDFWQQFCLGGSCFRKPTWVDEEAGIRAVGEQGDVLSGTTNYLAGTPFHVRNGFTGAALGTSEELLAAGYAVRLYLRVARIGNEDFDSGSSYLYEASSIIRADDSSCGPELFAGHGECVEWVFHFPDGLPAGEYIAIMEWVAPCRAWFETEVCDSPARPVGLWSVGGGILLVDEEFTIRNPRSYEWPFDPWAHAEPLPIGQEDGDG